MMRALFLLWLFFFAAAAVAPAATPRALTFEDLRRVVSVRSPHISPDGTRIVYVRSTIDWKADRNRSELVRANVDFAPQFIGKSAWTSPSEYNLYEAESPLSYAANVRTPTLIMSDAGDFRVPTPLAYEFYHEIRATGTPVRFLIYPVVGHFPRDPVRIEDIYRNWEAWFVKYLGS